MRSNRTVKFLLWFLLLSIFTASSNFLYSQRGSIEGLVIDKKSNETLTGANVIIQGTYNGTITDFDGKFSIGNLEPGEYNLSISFISYQPQIVSGIRVESNKISYIRVELEEISTTIEGVTVTATKKTGTEIALLSSIKTNNLIVSGISSQQITQTQDRDASEVVKRIPGITVIEDRFIVVRGLPQRYNSVWLNNAATPSSEADVKAFSFDVIPSSMIDNLKVYKSPSPDLPADFAGGFIKITTKNMPDKNEITFGISESYAQNTTFDSYLMYRGGKTDWLGFDDGTRDLPSQMPSDLNIYENSDNPAIRDKVTDIGRALNVNWRLRSSNAKPDTRFSFGINHRFALGKKSLGTVTFINYSHTMDNNSMKNFTYSIYDYVNDNPQYIDQIKDDQYTTTSKASIMHNWAFYMGNGQKIEFKNLFNQIGWSRSTVRDGIDGYNDNRIYKSYELRYLSRSTCSSQLSGEHSFQQGKTVIDWNAGYAYANKKEPDLKRYRLLQSNVDSTQFIMLFSNPGSPDLSSEARFWLDMDETIYSGSVNFLQKFTIGNFTPTAKVGLYIEMKDREFNARNFGYAMASNQSTFSSTSLPVEEIFARDNINRTAGIKLMETTSLSDSYNTSNDQLAGYVTLDIPVTSKLKLFGGVRVEKNNQKLSSYYQGTSEKANISRDTVNFFPSSVLTYNINEKNILRLSYGLSVNRPEFREIAPFYFVDFDLNAGIKGNTAIKQAYIHNYEFRYELYPSSGENLFVSGFYKKFEDPIEMIIIGNNPTQYSFDNVKSATCYGLELDIRKSLEFIGILKNFSVALNGALIKSKVHFDEGELFRDRPLQGQSPYIFNTSIFYQNRDKGLTVSVNYNIIGDRIIAVGRPSPNKWEDIPDIYEKSRNLVDLSVSKELGKYFEVKFNIKNALNSKVTYRQNIDTDVDMSYYTGNPSSGIIHFNRNQTTKEYRPGSYYTLGIIVKI